MLEQGYFSLQLLVFIPCFTADNTSNLEPNPLCSIIVPALYPPATSNYIIVAQCLQIILIAIQPMRAMTDPC